MDCHRYLNCCIAATNLFDVMAKRFHGDLNYGQNEKETIAMSQSITLTKLFNLSNGFYVGLCSELRADRDLNVKIIKADAANNRATLHLVGKMFDLAREEGAKKALINGEELDAVSDDLALGA